MCALGAATGSPCALSGMTARAVSSLRGFTQPSFFSATGCPVWGCSRAAALSDVPASSSRLRSTVAA